MARAFTLLETLMTVLVIVIVAAASISSYQGYRDRVAVLVDETNQKILAAAVKIAAANSGSVAGGLSELPPESVERAYALVTEGKRPYTLLAYLGEIWQEAWSEKTAHADTFLPSKYYKQDLKVITCLKDKTPPTGFDTIGKPAGGKSYDIHPQARNKSLSWLLDPNNASLSLIIETDDSGNFREFRHQRNGQKFQVETSVRAKHGFRTEATTQAEKDEVDEKD